MKNYRLLTLPLLLMASASMAQTISEGEALDKALQFKTAGRNARGTVDQPKVSLAFKAAAQDETYFYVYNYADGGFVIVGGDKAAHEILGYADEGQFEYDNLPDPMKWWLKEYEAQISHAIRLVRNGEATLAENDANGPRRAPSGAVNISPLLYTTGGHIEFDQRNPYNLAIDDGYGKFLTGCTTTAGAQVMRYYRHPSQDTGLSYPATTLYDEKTGVTGTAPAIEGNFTYNWSSIYPNYTRHDYKLTDEAAKYTANLFYRISRSIGAKYGSESTGASVANLGTSMIEHFKYGQTMRYAIRSNYADSEWEQLAYNELKAARPFVYEGQNVNGKSGHAFVLDGYDASNNTFHINWGWSGNYDGYFKITGSTALMPKGSGSGGDGADAQYSGDQRMLIGIQPDDKTSTQMIVCNDLRLSESECPITSRLTIDGMFQNEAVAPYTGNFGFLFEDKADASKKLTTDIGIVEDLRVTSYYPSLSTNIPAGAEVGHKYSVKPIFQLSNGSWSYMHLGPGCSELVVTITEAELSAYCKPFTLEASEMQKGATIYTSKSGFGNNSPMAATLTFGFKFTNISNPNDVAYCESTTFENLDSYSGWSTQMKLRAPSTLTIGQTYRVTSVFKDNNDQWQETLKTNAFDDPTVKITGTSVGDVNSDTKVNIGDVVTLRAKLSGKTPASYNSSEADLDRNSSVNNTDLELLKQDILNKK